MMNLCLDTGKCAPEGTATLRLQQAQLKNGTRTVQMFPLGTSELPLLESMLRYKNSRGVFHYNPLAITESKIEELSSKGRENVFLNLGPYDKYDIALRALSGEKVICITEYTPDGVEVRSAAGTDKTAPVQLEYFEQTKDNGNMVVVNNGPTRVLNQKGY